MTKQLFRDGKYVRDLDADESYTVKDRESIRFSMQFMDAMPIFDSAGHRPGAVSLTDAERDRRAQMYMDQKARLSSAWQHTPPTAPAVSEPRNTSDAAADAYDRRSVALENAWQKAGAV
ncbi:hypothetical protein HNQ36_003309 [Afipia massiliensis]|uniref:Uncharacterized protein n=1 Tax=Afipia massiliensis TaxID=211460 RepID=A0A840N659_9BRAD|nr:hypothetical protein [Afipia massiliensis]MBB5053318.1 hypothetical protein [Afipia massiliensis]